MGEIRMIKEGIRVASDELKDTDLTETTRRFEKNEASGRYLYRVVRTTIRIYGSGYVIELAREMISNPQHPRFNLRANSVMVARFWMLYIGKMYQVTKQKDFLSFVDSYLTHSDPRIGEEAKKRLEKIGAEEPVNTVEVSIEV